MTTARSIIRDSLTFGLNKLSPGEAEGADTFNTCLDALNNIADELNGQKAFLFREILTAGTVTGASGTLGSTWALSPGVQILGSTYANSADFVISEMTMAQYQTIPVKTTSGDPYWFAHDGLATVYFYPVPTSRVVTLRTKAAVTTFADLDTDYSMPAGYRSALADKLTKKLAPTLLGGVPASAVMDAKNADARLHAQAYVPAIVDAAPGYSYDIRTG